MNCVPFHLAVAESPRVAAFRIEPNYAPGALANFAQAPIMRQIVVIARIAQNDNRGPFVNRADMIG